MQVWQLSTSRPHPRLQSKPILSVNFPPAVATANTWFSFLLSGAPITAIQAISASVTTSQSTTQVMSAPVTITLSAGLSTITPTPTTLPSPTCPAANGSTYVATNKPLQTIGPGGPWQISDTSLSFKIFCETNFLQEGPILDLQIIENIPSLNDCLDQCALYNFRARNQNFPALGCTGAAWDRDPYDLCWLKSNVTLESPNGYHTAQTPPVDGAVLLGI